VRLVFAFGVVAAALLPALAGPLPARLRWARLGPAASGVLLLGLASVAPLESYRKLSPGFGFAAPTWPLAHFDMLRSLHLSGPIYTSDAWAGPMLGMFYPRHRAFFDNRIDAYPRGFVRDGYQHIRYGKPGWDVLLDRHGVQLVLMRYTSPGEAAYQRNAPNVRQKLAADARWALLFFDDWGELFVRRSGANAAQALALALDGIDPDRRRFLGPARHSADALMKALARGPRSASMLGMAALATADSGRHKTAEVLLAEAQARSPGDPWLAGIAARLQR
jgi:hypothetical protein